MILGTSMRIIVSLFLIHQTMMASCTSHSLPVGTSIWKQADDILGVHGANNVIFQSDVPYAIPGPGVYALGESLTSTASGSIITNNFPNVTIDLKQHCIVSEGASTVGISVGAAGEATITNGTIMQLVSTATGISLNGSTLASITKMRFVSNGTSVSMVGLTKGMLLEDCYFMPLNVIAIASVTSTALVVSNSSTVTVNHCWCINNNFMIASNSSNIIVDGIELIQAPKLITFTSINGSTVKNCYCCGGSISLTNSSYNIFDNCRFLTGGTPYLIITGSSTGNIIYNCLFQEPLVTTGGASIQIGSGVTNTRIFATHVYETRIPSTLTNNGTNTQVYNTLIRNTNSTIFSGNPLTTTPGDLTSVVNGTVNYWSNLFMN